MYLTLIGFWKNTSDVPDYIEDIRKATSQLSKGYTVLTDVSKMVTPPQKVWELHLVDQGVVIAGGLSKTAEVLPKNKAIEKTTIDLWSTKSGMEKRVRKTRKPGLTNKHKFNKVILKGILLSAGGAS